MGSYPNQTVMGRMPCSLSIALRPQGDALGYGVRWPSANTWSIVLRPINVPLAESHI